MLYLSPSSDAMNLNCRVKKDINDFQKYLHSKEMSMTEYS